MGAGSVGGGCFAEGVLLLLGLLDVVGGLEVPFVVGFETGTAARVGVEGGGSWCEF